MTLVHATNIEGNDVYFDANEVLTITAKPEATKIQFKGEAEQWINVRDAALVMADLVGKNVRR